MNLPETFEMPIEYRRVSFSKRLAAWLIDSATGIIVGLLLGLMAIGVEIVNISMMDPATLSELQDAYASLGLERSLATDLFVTLQAVSAGIIITTMLLSLLELFIGASIGKLTLGLEVAHMDGRRGNVQLWAKRWLVKNLATLFALIGLLPVFEFLGTIGSLIGLVITIGCFFALGKDRLALHDRIAQTAVFRKEDLQ
ncbi:MAG: RDD family protein [Candidatus Kapabacteria bacterium]|nr:RDD family protein [Candidatus Kapabacteria bacterium]